MPITFVCPQCGRSGRIPDGFQGSRVRCPACQAISPVQVEGLTDTTIPLAEEPREERKPARAERPKPVVQPNKEEEGASRRPMGLLIAGVTVAGVLFV